MAAGGRVPGNGAIDAVPNLAQARGQSHADVKDRTAHRECAAISDAGKPCGPCSAPSQPPRIAAIESVSPPALIASERARMGSPP